MVDALFIDPSGHYPALLGAEHCWDEKRDARNYPGMGPVILHPPCAAWCQLAGVREAKYGYPRGEDGGLFASALAQLVRLDGVLEHPAYSKAWAAFDLPRPVGVGWARRDWRGFELWVCQVSQCEWGHRARKRTWLLFHSSQGQEPSELKWGESYIPGTICISGAKNHSKKPTERMWTREAKRTPLKFAQTLIALAEHSR